MINFLFSAEQLYAYLQYTGALRVASLTTKQLHVITNIQDCWTDLCHLQYTGTTEQFYVIYKYTWSTGQLYTYLQYTGALYNCIVKKFNFRKVNMYNLIYVIYHYYFYIKLKVQVHQMMINNPI